MKWCAQKVARTDRIDVAAIVTPNHLHHAAATKFLEAGCHVICDKPLTTTVADAADLVSSAERARRVLAVTYNYSGYPLVRQAKEMIAAGELGELRVVQVEYAQDWLTTPLEAEGRETSLVAHRPAAGRRGRRGRRHRHARFSSRRVRDGLRVSQLAADLSTHVAGRKLDDNAQMLLRFANGARGGLWVSQVAAGNENGLRLRIYGAKGGLEWSQEEPNHLRHAPYGQQPRVIARGGPGATPLADRAQRAFRAGHPEGYLEAFAQVYRDIADLDRGV